MASEHETREHADDELDVEEWLEEMDLDSLDVLASHSTPEGAYIIGLATGPDDRDYLCSYITDVGFTGIEPLDLDTDDGRAALAHIAGCEGWNVPLSYSRSVKQAAERVGNTPWDNGYLAGAADRLPREYWPTGLLDEVMVHLSTGAAPRDSKERQLAWELARALAMHWQGEIY